MELSCLFVNFNSWRFLADALRSLQADAPKDTDGKMLTLEVIVVDNASSTADPAGQSEVEDLVAAIGGRIERSSENLGYAGGMNLAWSFASGELALVCNPDIVFGPGAITELVRHFQKSPNVGAVAPAVFADEDFEVHLPVHIVPRPLDLVLTALGTISRSWNRRYTARRTRAALPIWSTTEPVEEPMVGGCCFLTSRAVIDRVGFFDPEYPLYYEDTDLSHRIRTAGLRLLRIGTARVTHLYDRSAATNRSEARARMERSRTRYFTRWFGWRGRFVLALVRRLLGSRFGQARARRVANRPTRPASNDPPMLQLPRRCERFVVEIAFEPFLFLAAATFGSGDSWTPGPAAARRLDREAWLRVVDLTGTEPTELGIWHFRPGKVAEA